MEVSPAGEPSTNRPEMRYQSRKENPLSLNIKCTHSVCEGENGEDGHLQNTRETHTLAEHMSH